MGGAHFLWFNSKRPVTHIDMPSQESQSQGQKYRGWQCLVMLNKAVHSDIFAITFAVLTIYTLFAPNVLLLFGLSTEYTYSVALVNTIVLAFFLVETFLSCVFINGYMRSGRVFLDIMAMVALVQFAWRSGLNNFSPTKKPVNH